MSALGALIAGIAADIGARTVKRLIEQRVGIGAAEIAGTVIDVVAENAGVPTAELPGLAVRDRERVEQAVREAEAAAPELLALWRRGLEGQYALLQAETQEGFWRSAWRWGWMYLLGLFWAWTIVVAPVLNSWLIVPVETIDYGVLLTLTGWFMSLYMGGHTLKELGKNAMEAARGRAGGR